MSSSKRPDVSFVIVSFNTKNVLRECLQSIADHGTGVSSEILVVDNASADGSAEMVEQEFPHARVLRSEVNLGFAGANNLAFPHAKGRHVVLLNSDAFLTENALQLSVQKMDSDETIGLGGARLVGRDGSWQPSARQFPSFLNNVLCLSGLAAKFPRSRFFGRCDRTWADPTEPADVDWVPGAYSIIRREVLAQIGYFDESFFLYYEEVDLCKRIREAGWRISYWPDVVIVHVGGESSRTVKRLTMSSSGAQLTLWRMRSALLYHRKHGGLPSAWLARAVESGWHRLRAAINRMRSSQDSAAKVEESRTLVACMHQAWSETSGGVASPPRPW